MALRNHLVVMARAPRLGTVKTRLARGIGPAGALNFHRTTLERLLRRLRRDRRWTLRVALTPDRARLRGMVPVIPQGQGDLGVRMRRPMRRPPVGLPPGPVVVIGCDIPGIGPHHVAEAFRALGRSDYVFGPATDGGFWLVGARRRPAEPHDLFAGVRWSEATTLAETLARLRRGQRAALVAVMDDVDDEASWRRWRSRKLEMPSG
ncbi:TIGR04282 family arsenosugar biosynthesis glycosyltransferase [Arenibaculum pallidiluteum]|uniref:TIGR04282 family arsenosugar biosynthesis glycosyltransferase n=1 Tax=Arenibaculum pallidiluteum TaxID=2812559 RepID=UPI001A96F327|nr:TIGR04282 family arsenosugar biosynthesis glycosyltransferase [Arenibaculum pallidiluteum]